MNIKVDSQNLKKETESEIINESLLKIETIDGMILYVFTQLRDYQLMSRTLFSIAKIHIYMEKNSKIQCFIGDIENINSLNQDIDWDRRYFDKIRTVLEIGGKEFNYFFITDNDETEFKVTEKIFFQAHKKMNQTTEATILKVNLKFAPQLSTLDHLLNLIMQNINNKNKKIQELTKNVEKVEGQKKSLYTEIDNILQASRDREETLLNKFVLLLNEKKKKIRDFSSQNLPEFEEKIIRNQFEEEQNSFILSMRKPPENQDEQCLSQPGGMGTLFEPSLNPVQSNQMSLKFEQKLSIKEEENDGKKYKKMRI